MNPSDSSVTLKLNQEPPPPPSQHFGGKYQVHRTLGKGGMGTVFLAKDTVLERWVAIKTMHIDLVETSTNNEAILRFQREAKTMATLQHPNIVGIHDAGWEEELFYLAMEYVEGKTLKEKLATQERLPLDEAVALTIQACHGLETAHQAGLVHRDIKPANILIKEDGTVKIMDFGLAHTFASDLTATAQVMGTPNYMSPEQIQAPKNVDRRSDIFSLGVVLYELLTGEKTFPGRGFSSISWKIMHENPVPPSRILSLLPSAVDHIIQKCLAKSPEERYASCTELANDLEHLLTKKERIGTRPAPPSAPDNAHAAVFKEIERFHRDNINDPLLEGNTSFSLNLLSLGISTFPIVYRLIRRQVAFINRIGAKLTPDSDWVPIPLAFGWYLTGFIAYLFGSLGMLLETVLLTIMAEKGYFLSTFFSTHSGKILGLFAITQILMIFGMAILQFWSWSRANQIDTLKQDWTHQFGADWPESWRTSEEQLAVYATTLFHWTYVPLLWMLCTQIILGISLNTFIYAKQFLASSSSLFSGLAALIGLDVLGVIMFGFMITLNNAAITRSQRFTVDKSKKIGTKFLSFAAYINVIWWGLAIFLININEFIRAWKFLTK